ncbi:hypothetical protein RHSIM_Rhsim08G0035500 [Rhododendron simsii]|uniref:DUF8204 domain-containing protein n=1 Tax=Rhododendron simsii TaxID=118357 RepID=A0A834LEI6_RHOSS|nr:hypothetical protein RHSIM_Rhsim08G0035500 [Rhododendron simsii]
MPADQAKHDSIVSDGLHLRWNLTLTSRLPPSIRLASAVPRHIVGETELDASREGRSLVEFKYACVGYSVYSNGKDPSVDGQQTQAELPICVGLEALVGKKASAPDSVPAHVHVHNKEDSHGFPQPQPQPRTHQPARFQGDEFMSKFSRNAGLVAMGVAKNLYRVGNSIKGRIDGILYPYRSRPK